METLGEEHEKKKKIETILELIGNVCENSQQNHDELLSKLEKIKKKIGNRISDTV